MNFPHSHVVASERSERSNLLAMTGLFLKIPDQKLHALQPGIRHILDLQKRVTFLFIQ
jgi:hypothetical protein